MKGKIILTIALGICVILMTHGSLAQPPAPQGPPPAGAVGTDKPGPPQCPAPNRPGMEEVFKKADKNADGLLTLEEFLEFHKNRPPMPPGRQGMNRPDRPPKMRKEDKERRTPAGRGPEGKAERPERPKKPERVGPPEERMKIRAEEVFKKADKVGDGKLS